MEAPVPLMVDTKRLFGDTNGSPYLYIKQVLEYDINTLMVDSPSTRT